MEVGRITFGPRYAPSLEEGAAEMLTVKHVDRDGREVIFEATDVHRTPEGRLAFGQEKTITTGKVYIMNDAGKTVAVYDFDKQQ